MARPPPAALPATSLLAAQPLRSERKKHATGMFFYVPTQNIVIYPLALAQNIVYNHVPARHLNTIYRYFGGKGNDMKIIKRNGSEETFCAAGITDIVPCAEILPGVPVLRVQSGDTSFHLISKAGGFGEENCFTKICQSLLEGCLLH